MRNATAMRQRFHAAHRSASQFFGGHLQVQTRRSLDASGRYRVDVTFTKKYIGGTVQLHLSAIFRFEQDAIAILDCAYVGADTHHLGPQQPFPDLSSGGYDDPTRGLALSVRTLFLHEHAVMQQLDRQLGT